MIKRRQWSLRSVKPSLDHKSKENTTQANNSKVCLYLEQLANSVAETVRELK